MIALDETYFCSLTYIVINKYLRDEASIININSKLICTPLFILKSLHTSKKALQIKCQASDSYRFVRDKLTENMGRLKFICILNHL